MFPWRAACPGLRRGRLCGPVFRLRGSCAVMRLPAPGGLVFRLRRALARRFGPPAPPCPAPRCLGAGRGLGAEKLFQA